MVEISAVPKDMLLGTTLEGRYLIQQKLGEGSMGIVYLATHALIGKKCAVKVLRGDVVGDDSMAERFIQEARSAATIGNEHIIEITDFGKTTAGYPYFVMEYLDGVPLQDLLKEAHTLELRRALHIADQCCEALAKAHEAGVVHRDLKPENLVLVRRGADPDFVKVLDFGIAKVARENGRLTRTGTIFGTPLYMAPEQAAGTTIDERVDIYSLGIILYEMLSGRVPFVADTFMGVLTKHLYEAPIPPSELVPPVKIPKTVECIILKAIAKKPEQRFPSMVALKEEIGAILAGQTPQCFYEDIKNSSLPPSPASVVGSSDEDLGEMREGPLTTSRRSRLPIYIGLGVVLAAAIGVWLFSRHRDEESRTASNKDTRAQTHQVMPAPEDVPLMPTNRRTEHSLASEGRLITLKSKPPDTTLYRNGTKLGNLPFKVARPSMSGRDVRYTLKRDGFEDAVVTVTDAMAEELVVEMMPIVTHRDLSPDDRKTKPDPGSEANSRRSGDDTRKKKKKTKKIQKSNLGGDIMDPWG